MMFCKVVKILSCFIVMPAYLSRIVFLNGYEINCITIINIVVYMISLPIFGCIADKYGKILVMRIGLFMVILLIIPFYYFLSHKSNYLVHLVEAIFVSSCAAYIAPIPAFLCDLYGVEFRISAISLVYNTSSAIFGGLSPLIVFWLIEMTGLKIAPAMYIIFFSSFALLLFLNNNKTYLFQKRFEYDSI